MKVLLVDDEELALARLRKLLAAYDDVIVVGEAGDGEEAIQAVAELRPDAVFLDIKMPGADGLEVVRSLGSRRPKIVFCTAFDEYAVEAFELHAVDYLLKPVTRARLAVCIEHLRRIPAAEWDVAVERIAGSAAGATRFLARYGTKYRVVGQREVEYFSFEEGLTALHTATGRFAMDPTLNVLESRLDPDQFFRISRGVIVRLDAVLEVAPLVGGYGEVRLRNGMCFPVSRRRFRNLLEKLEGRRTEPH
jgi:two-component system LytT family response regulator